MVRRRLSLWLASCPCRLGQGRAILGVEQVDLLHRDPQVDHVARTHAARGVDDGDQVVLAQADVEQLLVAQELDHVA